MKPDGFEPGAALPERLGVTPEEAGRLLMGDGVSEGAPEDLEEVRRRLEAARPELEDLQDRGLIDAGTARRLLLGGGSDPHVSRSIPTDGSLSTRPILRADGSVVAGGGDGLTMKYLTAYAPDGTVLWRSKDLVDKTPAADRAGNFYFAKNQGTVSYGPDGKRRWLLDRSRHAPGYREYGESHSGDCSGSSGIPAVDEARGTVYLGEWYGKFFALDSETGAVKWVRYRPGMIGTCDPALDREGNVFFHDDNGYVLSLNPDGSENWIVGVGLPDCYPRGAKVLDDPSTSLWMDEVGRSRRDYDYKEGDEFSVGTPQALVGPEQRVVFGMRDGRLLALNHDTGSLESFFDAGDSIFGAPLAAGDGRVVFATNEGHVFCVDTENPVPGRYGPEMRLLWERELDKYGLPEMVDGQGRVYLSSPDRGLMVVDRDGALLWQAALKPETGVVQAADGSVAITCGPEILFVEPLADRVAGLGSDGAGREAPRPVIEQDERQVTIGEVVLDRRA